MSFDLGGLIHSDEPWIWERNDHRGKSWADCKLCDETDMDDHDNYNHHLRQTSHQERVEEAEQALTEEKTFSTRRHQLARLEPRISTLALRVWRDRLHVLLFSYLTEIESTSFDTAIEVLEKYENIERVSFLQLAIWKAACQNAHPPNCSGDAVFWQQWLKTGWKVNKEEMRNSSTISIVINSVLPFLGMRGATSTPQLIPSGDIDAAGSKKRLLESPTSTE